MRIDFISYVPGQIANEGETVVFEIWVIILSASQIAGFLNQLYIQNKFRK